MQQEKTNHQYVYITYKMVPYTAIRLWNFKMERGCVCQFDNISSMNTNFKFLGKTKERPKECFDAKHNIHTREKQIYK